MDKIFLCFWVGDEADSESFSVYYAHIVYAKDEEEALDKYMTSGKQFAQNVNRKFYGVREMKENDIIK